MRNMTLLFTVGMLCASSASAYEMRSTKWKNSPVAIQANLEFTALMYDEYAVLVDAASKINANASAIGFSLTPDNDTVTDQDNGESELDFTTDSDLLCGSIACTWVWSSGNYIDEADAFFDESYAWALDDYKLNNIAYSSSGTRPLINTGMHELLHTLGAKHENDCINILGNAWNVVNTNGDYTETVVSEDTTAGLIATYGTYSGSIQDLSVMHWKLDTASTGTGDYSKHMRSKLLNSSGSELSKVSGTSEVTYKASAGNSIQVEMTLENRGTATQTRKLGVYWSKDSTITTGDSRLYSSNVTLAVNTPYENKVSVTIPSSATKGTTYWVGAIIDYNNAISENNESNNAAYIAAIQIQ